MLKSVSIDEDNQTQSAIILVWMPCLKGTAYSSQFADSLSTMQKKSLNFAVSLAILFRPMIFAGASRVEQARWTALRLQLFLTIRWLGGSMLPSNTISSPLRGRSSVAWSFAMVCVDLASGNDCALRLKSGLEASPFRWFAFVRRSLVKMHIAFIFGMGIAR